ncbi:hypothetical protein TNCV_4889561 [Trichonephila clavipes]|nr:hypothetical protein TNCV_4889561 [Trichonephila clavipes]
MSLDLSSMSLDPKLFRSYFWETSVSFYLPSMSLDLFSMSMDLSSMSLDLSNMSLDLSNMSFDLFSMSLDPSNMSFYLSSMSFVDDPLSQSSLWGGMKHFLSALKNLLVGNLKNFILFIHDCFQENFEGYTLIETLNTTLGYKNGESRQESYKKSRWNVPWGSEKQGLDKKEGDKSHVKGAV